MKKIVYLVLLLFAWTTHAWSQNKIVANITNFKNDKGICRACLFNTASSFANNKPFQCLQVTPSGKTANAVFESIPDGEYAMFVFHDANNNGGMDKNWLGIPKEGYGASMNKLPFASAPGFEANKFAVSSKTTRHLSIRLRNL